MSVVFPAPFSPRRAWTWPGATDRLIPSFAASGPNLLVMPLSSSSTGTRPRAQVTGLLVGVWMDPFTIPVSMVFSSDCSEAGTVLAKSWNGESIAPPFCSVPT